MEQHIRFQILKVFAFGFDMHIKTLVLTDQSLDWRQSVVILTGFR